MKYSNENKNEKIKGLSEYFDAAKSEKSSFTADKAANLIKTGLAGGASVGIIDKILGKLYFKNLAMSLGVAGLVGASGVYINSLIQENKTGVKSNKSEVVIANKEQNNNATAIETVKKSENNNVSSNLSPVKNITFSSADKKIELKSNIKPENNLTEIKNEIEPQTIIDTKPTEISVTNDYLTSKLLLASSIKEENYMNSALPLNQNTNVGVNGGFTNNQPKNRLLIQTLFGESKVNSFWINTSNSFTRAFGKTSLQSGGQLGWTMNNSLSMGVFGYGITEKVDVSAKMNGVNNNGSVLTASNMNIGCGGLFFEYTQNDKELIHYGGGLALGVGGASVSGGAGTESSWNTFVTLIPKVYVEANLFKWMKAGIQSEYRADYMVYKNDAFKNDEKLSNSTSSALSVGLFFKFGLFDL